MGAAVAGDLDALDFEFEFFLAMGPAADDGELVVGDVGRRNALEHVVFDGDLNAGVECFELAWLVGSDAGELGGGFDAVGGEFSPAFFFEAAKGGDVCLYAEAFGRGQRDFLDDLFGGHVEEPVVDLVELFVGEVF